jgi:NADH:ubiquinone oxidoreductase subunit F (NADH-binding)
VVVANGEEGEPASFKDQWLLTHRPHLVIDGLLLAAQACGADRAVLYLAHEATREAVKRALSELADNDILKLSVSVEVFMVAPTYVAGEETSAVRAISGGPALPLAKPPRPFEKGVDGLPTLVANVETLAHAAWISRHGAVAYRGQGSEDSPGTTLVTLSGACNRPGVYEVPFGVSIRSVVDTVGGGFASEPRGLAIGGWFGGLSGPVGLDLSCEFGACKAAGNGWGCGAITILGQDDDPVQFAAGLAAWYERESARQCGVCIKGTAAIAQTLQSLGEHRATSADRDNLVRWGQMLPGRGACAFLDGAAALSRTVIVHFPNEVAEALRVEQSESE